MGQKLKTNKALASRIKITKNGKFMHAKAGKNHLLTNKKKAQRKSTYGEVLAHQTRRLAKLLPYS